jgi:hypothetical protein
MVVDNDIKLITELYNNYLKLLNKKYKESNFILKLDECVQEINELKSDGYFSITLRFVLEVLTETLEHSDILIKEMVEQLMLFNNNIPGMLSNTLNDFKFKIEFKEFRKVESLNL